MKIQGSRFAVVTSTVALILSSLVGVQPAGAATLDVAPVLTINGLNAELQAGTGTWSAGSTQTWVYVCGTAKTAAGPLAYLDSGHPMNMNCVRLWSNSARTIGFTGGDLTTAYYAPSQLYNLTGVASYPHVLVLSTNTDGGTTLVARSASQRFSLSPAYSGSLSFSVSGSVLTFSTPTWGTGTPTSASNPSYDVFGCTAVSFGVVTPSTGNPSSCTRLDFASSSGQTRDLATATTSGNPYNFASPGNRVIVVASVTGYGGTTFRIWTASQVYPPAAAPTAVVPVFTIANSGAIAISTPASWTGHDSASAKTDVVACTSAKSTAVSTPANPSTFNAGCTELWASTATLQNLVSPTTMVGAKVFDGSTFVDFDPSVHGSHISIFSYARYTSVLWGVAAATQQFQAGSASPAQVEATPYTGPIVQAPGALRPVASGARMVLDGSNLTGVSKVTIDGKDASGKVNSEGKLEITVPEGLASGTYDLVITSDSGLLTVQDAIVISGSSFVTEATEARPSTRLKEDNTVKVYVFHVVGAGKVQIMHNGKEVAWVNTNDPDDAKILNDYLVRTLELVDGKNVIEIWVDGKRVDRKAYTKKTDVDLRA